MDGVVGYGFHPTNAELIGYLRKKRLDPEFTSKKIGEIHLYNHEPPELPGLALVQSDAPVCYFYVALDYKHANRKRACANRRTRGGTWKATGKERDIKDSRTKKVIGTKRTLVFYNGHTTSRDARTNWVMHEYHCKPVPLFKGDFVVVRIKIKPNYKSDALTPIESKASHHLTSDSGDHSEVVSQVESLPLQNNLLSCNSEDHTANIMFSKKFQSPSNHGTYLNKVSQLLPNNGIFINRGSLLLSNDYRELQPEFLSSHDVSIDREYCALPNHNVSINRESQMLLNHNELHTSELLLPELLPDHGISSNRESQQDISINRESQLLPNHGEVKDNRRDSQLAAQDGFYNEETVLSLPSNFYYSNPVAGAFVCDELPPNHGISINRESQQNISINGEFQLLPNYGEVEGCGSNISQWSAQDEFYVKETDLLLPPNRSYSNPVTGASACDGTDAEAEALATLLDGFSSMVDGEYDFNSTFQPQSYLLLPPNLYYSNPVTGASACDGTDAEAEALATLLDGFSSMVNGEYDFNSTFQPQSYPAVTENVLPVQTGSVV